MHIVGRIPQTQLQSQPSLGPYILRNRVHLLRRSNFSFLHYDLSSHLLRFLHFTPYALCAKQFQCQQHILDLVVHSSPIRNTSFDSLTNWQNVLSE